MNFDLFNKQNFFRTFSILKMFCRFPEFFLFLKTACLLVTEYTYIHTYMTH